MAERHWFRFPVSLKNDLKQTERLSKGYLYASLYYTDRASLKLASILILCLKRNYK